MWGTQDEYQPCLRENHNTWKSAYTCKRAQNSTRKSAQQVHGKSAQHKIYVLLHARHALTTYTKHTHAYLTYRKHTHAQLTYTHSNATYGRSNTQIYTHYPLPPGWVSLLHFQMEVKTCSDPRTHKRASRALHAHT